MNVMTYLTCIYCHAWICIIKQIVIAPIEESVTHNMGKWSYYCFNIAVWA